MTDTSRDTVEGFALGLEARGFAAEAETMRALLTERDELRGLLVTHEICIDKVKAERDAAKLLAAEAVVALNKRDSERMQAEREARKAEAERDIARREEREACAVLCEESPDHESSEGAVEQAHYLAYAIRARSNP
jgi:hypothetical protein